MRDEDKTADGQSFYAAHLTGSGTIREDGTYGPPEPDPTVKRGGPKGANKSPGGVERPAPEDIVPPAQRPTQSTKRSASK